MEDGSSGGSGKKDTSDIYQCKVSRFFGGDPELTIAGEGEDGASGFDKVVHPAGELGGRLTGERIASHLSVERRDAKVGHPTLFSVPLLVSVPTFATGGRIGSRRGVATFGVATQELGDEGQGALGGGEANAIGWLAGDGVEALKREGEVGFALVAGESVNFIDDDGVDVAAECRATPEW